MFNVQLVDSLLFYVCFFKPLFTPTLFFTSPEILLFSIILVLIVLDLEHDTCLWCSNICNKFYLMFCWMERYKAFATYRIVMLYILHIWAECMLHHNRICINIIPWVSKRNVHRSFQSVRHHVHYPSRICCPICTAHPIRFHNARSTHKIIFWQQSIDCKIIFW